MNAIRRRLQALPPETQRLILIASVMMAAVVQVLDTTIANVALPHMQGTMSATQDQISWVLTSYIIAAVIAMPLTGWLAGRVGRKRMLVLAIIGFTVASGLCGLAQNLSQMIAFRIVQGITGACLVPVSQSLLLDHFPMDKQAKAMSIWGLGMMVAPIMGPTLGGWLTEYYSWRWVFYINLPLGVLALLGVMSVVKETPIDRERRFDWLGFLLLSVAVGSLQLMLDRGQHLYWFESPEIIAELVISLAAFYMFVVHMITHERPFIEPALFHDTNFALGLMFVFMLGVVLLSTLALMPPYLQNLMGYPVFEVGLIMAPRGIGTMLAMMFAGRLMEKIGERAIIIIGLLMTAFSVWSMTKFTVDVSRATITWIGLVQGAGLGFVFVALSTIAFSTLQPQLRTEAASIFALVRNIGSSLGISIVVSQLADSMQRERAVLSEHISPFNSALVEPLQNGAMVNRLWNLDSAQGLATLNGEVMRQAAQIAYIDDFQIIMCMALAAIPFALMLKPPPRIQPSP